MLKVMRETPGRYYLGAPKSELTRDLTKSSRDGPGPGAGALLLLRSNSQECDLKPGHENIGFINDRSDWQGRILYLIGKAGDENVPRVRP